MDGVAQIAVRLFNGDKMNKDNPRIHLLIQYSKEELANLCNWYGISDVGTKLDMAIRLAEREDEVFKRNWENRETK